MNDCIFCRILAGEIPSKKLYEDEQCGEDAGQTVKHLHFRVLGGKTLGSFN